METWKADARRRRPCLLLVLSLAAALAGAVPARAQVQQTGAGAPMQAEAEADLGALLERAAEAYRSGDVAEAARLAYDAVLGLGAAAPLELRRVGFVEPGSIKAFGMYTPRANNLFAPGEEVWAYLEVANFQLKPTGDQYRISLAEDLEVLDQNRNTVLSAPAVIRFDSDQIHSPMINFYLQNQIQFSSELPPGNYILVFRVWDRLSLETDQAELPFVIEAAGETPGGAPATFPTGGGAVDQ